MPRRLLGDILLISDWTRDDSAAEARLEKIEKAIDVLGQLDERRLIRLALVDKLRIVISEAPGPYYDAGANICVLPTAMVVDWSPVLIALVVVHEATHARIHRAGIRYKPALRERIERRCVREQMAVAALAPDGERLVAWLEQTHAESWYTEPQMRRRQLEELRLIGVPRWVITVLRALVDPNASTVP